MGRGRAKAKQTKVARRLKYQTLGTNLDDLQRELSGVPETAAPVAYVEPEDDPSDEYADLAARYGFDDEDDDE